MSIASEWNIDQKKMNELIKKENTFEAGKKLFMALHASVHFSVQSGLTILDKLWDGLEKSALGIMPTEKDVTIAWNIWHITRIEDLTANILISAGEQVLNGQWLKKIGTSVTDTGNAMTDEQIISFSREIDPCGLRDYRIAVGERTKSILSRLDFMDMKRTVDKKAVAKIRRIGGVIEHPDSIWLLDFWSKKNISGIIKMPLTRHQIVHINDSLRLKDAISKKRFFIFHD